MSHTNLQKDPRDVEEGGVERLEDRAMVGFSTAPLGSTGCGGRAPGSDRFSCG
jgi:hypothetical protein